MTIPYFAEQQDLVFVPALIAVLVAVLVVCLPVVFAPRIARWRRGARGALIAAAAVVAVVALGTAGWRAGVGVRVLHEQRAQVRTEIGHRWGIDVSSGEAGTLVDGDPAKLRLPQLAQQLQLRSTKSGAHDLEIVEEDSGSYGLTYGGVTVPPST